MRFPGFEGEWTSNRLGDFAKFSKGKGISKIDIDENGETECIRYGELYTHYGEVIDEIKSKTSIDKSSLVLSEENDVIIPASGETQIDIATASCVLKSGIALGGDLNIIKTLNNGVFVSYYLNSKKKIDIARLSQGISVVHLYSSQLTLLSLNLPSLAEQHKIAMFLSLISDRISKSMKIIENLETLMNGFRKNIFFQKLRFKNENRNVYQNFKYEKLGEFGVFFSGGTPLTSKRQYYNGNIPFIKSGEISASYTEQFISEEALKNSSAKIVKIGDVLYALYGATSGEVSISKIAGAINQAVLCIRTDLNNYYLLNYLKFKKDNILKTYLQGGQGNLSSEIIKSLIIPIPDSGEQTKIANFLFSIAEKIETEKKILKQFENQKKYLLTNLFV